MPFWRSWAAALLGASGAAVAVPVGLLLTVMVAAGLSGGGFGGLHQLTRGPDIPGVTGGAPRAAAPLDGGLPVLPQAGPPTAAEPAGPARAAASSAPRPAARRPAAPAGSPARPAPVSTPPRTTATAPAVPVAVAVPVPVPAAPVAAPAVPAPATRPNPVRELVRTVQDVVEPVPVLGPPVADAVGSVADLILPPLPGRTGAPAGPAPAPAAAASAPAS